MLSLNVIMFSDINECLASDWCAHGGQCTNNDGGFSCNCDSTGYKDDRCQTGNIFHVINNKTWKNMVVFQFEFSM